MIMDLTHRLDRTVTIQAAPETVFRFFQESPRWARWWGAGSTIDPRPGGKVYIRHPNGIETVGEVLELDPPERIVFTYGYASGNPIPPGASRVTIHLSPVPAGTRLELLHEFDDASIRDQHIQGWRFQLSLFGNAVADDWFADAAELVDAWFAGWSAPEGVGALVAPGIVFKDRYSMLEGADELSAHVGAAQRFMPGIRLERKGGVRHCQGVVLADWAATKADGSLVFGGTNVFVLGPDKKFTSVTGIGSESK
jgi:uncharacterized protein YndB with AHSA1/START domain